MSSLSSGFLSCNSVLRIYCTCCNKLEVGPAVSLLSRLLMRISTEKTENADIGMRLVLTKVPELTNGKLNIFQSGTYIYRIVQKRRTKIWVE